MKSVLLTDIQKPDEVRAALSGVLPGQQEPWLLLAAAGDPIAYFHVDTDGEVTVTADISGRHYNEDDAVIGVLQKIQLAVGGKIETEV